MKQEYTSKPKTVSSVEAASFLVGKKKIAVLTGSGVSALSGVATHIGEDGKERQQEKRYVDYENKDEILTRSKFLSDPNAVWDWLFKFKQNIAQCKPNVVHKAIREFQEHCFLEHELSCQLITECIDGLHTEEILNSQILEIGQSYSEGSGLHLLNEHVQETQGNAKYMACPRETCGDIYFASPSADECFLRQQNSFQFVNDQGKTETILETPTCDQCGSTMKPHVLLWDEKIDEVQYKTETVRNFTKEADCLIVIGTSVENEKSRRTIESVLRREVPVIEINPDESVINKGNNIIVKEKLEVAVEKLFQEYFYLTGARQRPEMGSKPNIPTQSRSKSTRVTQKPSAPPARQPRPTTQKPQKQVRKESTNKPSNQAQQRKSSVKQPDSRPSTNKSGQSMREKSTTRGMAIFSNQAATKGELVAPVKAVRVA